MNMSTMAYRPVEKHGDTHAVSDLVQIRSSKAAWEILTVLARVTGTSRPREKSGTNCRRFSGKVTRNNFKLVYSTFSNPFIRTMQGRVLPMDGGCLIQYRLEVSMIARIFFCLWFLAVTTICLSKIGSAILNGIAPGGYDDFVMLFIFIAGSLYIGQIIMAESKRQEKQMVHFLAEIASNRRTLSRV